MKCIGKLWLAKLVLVYLSEFSDYLFNLIKRGFNMLGERLVLHTPAPLRGRRGGLRQWLRLQRGLALWSQQLWWQQGWTRNFWQGRWLLHCVSWRELNLRCDSYWVPYNLDSKCSAIDSYPSCFCKGLLFPLNWKKIASNSFRYNLC